MVQTRLGRRKSLAICTLCTGLSTFAFIRVEQKWAVVVSSMVISAAATAMYAVLCELRRVFRIKYRLMQAERRWYDAGNFWDFYKRNSMRHISSS